MPYNLKATAPLEQALFTRIEMSARRIDNSYWEDTYAVDILQTLKECEMRRPLVLFRSPQSEEHRPALLRLLRSSIEICKLNRCTLHLSVYFLDHFLDIFSIRLDKLNLTALTCLHIAAQIEDSDPNIPKFGELNHIVGFCYTWEEFRTVERKVLTTFNFELLRPTTCTFVEYFARNFLTLEDYELYRQDYVNRKSVVGRYNFLSYEHMLGFCTNLLFQFADNTLTYHKFVNARPSVLAASCICAVRQQCGIKPYWNAHLIELTSYNEELLKPFVDIINTIHEMHIQRQIGLLNNNSNNNNNNNGNNNNGNNNTGNNNGIATNTIWTTPAKIQNETSNDWSSPDSGVESLQDIYSEQSTTTLTTSTTTTTTTKATAVVENVIVLPAAQPLVVPTHAAAQLDIANVPVKLNNYENNAAAVQQTSDDSSIALNSVEEYVPQPCDSHEYAMPAKRRKLI